MAGRFILIATLVILCCPAVKAQAGSEQKTIPDSLEKKFGFSEKQLRQFVDAAVQVVPMQEKAHQRMEQTIRNQDLDVHQYYRIQSYINASGNRRPPPTITPENIQSYRQAEAQVKRIVRQHAKEVADTIAASDIGLEKYRKIMKVYQKEPAVQEAVTVILREKYNVKTRRAGLTPAAIREIQEKAKQKRKEEGGTGESEEDVNK